MKSNYLIWKHLDSQKKSKVKFLQTKFEINLLPPSAHTYLESEAKSDRITLPWEICEQVVCCSNVVAKPNNVTKNHLFVSNHIEINVLNRHKNSLFYFSSRPVSLLCGGALVLLAEYFQFVCCLSLCTCRFYRIFIKTHLESVVWPEVKSFIIILFSILMESFSSNQYLM